jgi:hypothetical protein
MSDQVIDACEACYEANNGDCSAFVRAVAGQLGVTLVGNADDIVDTLRASAEWMPVADGVAAAQAAKDGKLVIAGLKGAEQAVPNPHGHCVVVVDGPLAHAAYPTAYWGGIGGQPGKNQTLNWAWTGADRDRVSYGAHEINGSSGSIGISGIVNVTGNIVVGGAVTGIEPVEPWPLPGKPRK